jgi:hypothetical protein
LQVTGVTTFAFTVFLQITHMIFFLSYGPIAASVNGFYKSTDTNNGLDVNSVVSMIYMAMAALFSLPAM